MYKESFQNEESDYIELTYLYALIWRDFSIASMSQNNDNANNLAFSSLTTTMSNSLIAIIKLSMDGLDYQAINILRNLYEMGLLTLNICIDKQKRTKFIESASKENS